MGRPKLLLPLGEQTVIARLLAALETPAIVARIVVLRRNDVELRRAVEQGEGSAVCPDVDPPDMRASLLAGLDWIEERHQPTDADAWLLTPADHPVLARDVVAELLEAFHARRPRWLVPTCGGKRGHPLIARWDTVRDVRQLPPDAGLNSLLRREGDHVVEHPVASPAVLCDLDTPEDYRRLVEEFAANRGTARGGE
jgi:molybdenum cofactor cytidylyltransferase